MPAFTMVWLDMAQNVVDLWQASIDFMPTPQEQDRPASS